MKTVFSGNGIEKKEISESEKPEAPVDEKKNKEIRSESKAFFQSFSQRQQEKKTDVNREEELFLDEVRQMDANTAPEPAVLTRMEESSLTEEELQEIYDQDPGYVNAKVLDYDNELEKKENTYSETGSHTGAVRWGDYAGKEGVEYITLRPGTLLSRWGSEKGTFLSDTDVSYEQLELPVSSDKNEQNFYEVLKPFPVEISKIAVQPWNEADKTQKEDTSQNTDAAMQYKAPISVEELVKNGYLKKATPSENR